MLFSELELKPTLLAALTKIGYAQATPIQEQVITRFLKGNHIVGQSQTGTGKTAAFVIPLINAIDPKSRHLQGLVLCPTRELVQQTEEEFYNLSYGTVWFKSCRLMWGGGMRNQIERLQQGCQVIVATPGRLIDMVERGFVDLSTIDYLVLDEADRMLDMGFSDDVDYIISMCENVKQVMSFSATITRELNDMLVKYIGNDYESIKIHTEIIVDKVDHGFIHTEKMSKVDLLDRYLEKHRDEKVIIFTQTKMACAQIAENLEFLWHKVAVLNGDLEQRDRTRIIKAYKADEIKILVATDVASRGLNLNDVSLVVNFDVPQDPESYVHRIGRTARAGAEGKAITFVNTKEMSSIGVIERRNKITIKQVDEAGNVIERKSSRPGPGGRSSGGRTYGTRSGGGSYGGRSSSSSSRGSSYSSKVIGSRGGFGSRASENRMWGERRFGGSPRGDRAEGGRSFSRDGDRTPRSFSSRGDWERSRFGSAPRGDRSPRRYDASEGGERKFWGGDRAPRKFGDHGGSGRSSGPRTGGYASRGGARPARTERSDRPARAPRKEYA